MPEASRGGREMATSAAMNKYRDKLQVTVQRTTIEWTVRAFIGAGERFRAIELIQQVYGADVPDARIIIESILCGRGG